MNLTLAVVGAVLVAITILGGGLRVGGVQIANISRLRIVLLAGFGVVTMALGLYLELSSVRAMNREPANNSVHVPSAEPAQGK